MKVDKKVGHKVSEWELHLCEYAADGTDKSINLANTGKSSNPSIFTVHYAPLPHRHSFATRPSHSLIITATLQRTAGPAAHHLA